ncbi:MAG: disulfide bond formation protein B [Candidatus Competibacteraceae bacterium]|nr:disulfide bond formation protein B [Candidatus Competibacteraceae bacterium]MBK7983961.1 disulfide bond formation protein B [Candidatus Competibacteraceae bacterium]MBK8897497.1 disulfide bond formation protein B [Candidatus Competibacteraceae bacterium]MBK8963649.1 disulfide bond formation protein B [Candidatus Competibacteraceae bacterium]MBK9950540.1 disulfide bond formation protein B [Candidatus Competibacteraceae bacterium]
MDPAAGSVGGLSRRRLNALGFLICALALGYAYYAQYGQGIAPCPLCILQRLALLAVGLALLAAAVHNPRDTGAKVYGVLIDLAATVGMAIAARHVWLQQLPPDQAPRCGPTLEYMLRTFPLGETLREVLTGSGECAKVDWALLGISMPVWNLLLFISLGTIGLLGNWRLRR